MSKPTFVNGDTIDLKVIRSVMKDDLCALFQQIEGPKCVVLDMDLGKSINIALEGAAIFKENNVVTFLRLTGEKIFTEALNIVFICKSNVDTLKLVVQVIEQLRGDSTGYSFYILFVPFRNYLAIQYLRDCKIYDFVSVFDLEMNLIPIDNDLLSMEHTGSFSDLYITRNYFSLKELARALLKLQVLYGPFRSIDSLGLLSRSVVDLMRELRPEEPVLSDIPTMFNRLVLVDRSIDFISAFTTSLTYESLIHEFLSMECGTVTMDGGLIGKREGVPVTISLNSNDALFAEIANSNVSVIPQLLKEKLSEIETFTKNRPINSDCSISEITAYAGKVGTVSELKESLQIHLEIAKEVTEHTNSPAFGERWQKEREILEGANVIDFLHELFNCEYSIEDVLHYLIMYSAVNKGFKAKDFDAIRKEFLFNFGFQYLPLLASLEKAGLLIRRDGSNNYSSVKSKMRLIREDINGTQQTDLNYVTSGYAPLSARIIQALLGNTSPMEDVAKLNGFAYVHEDQIVQESVDSVDVVVFVGGMTYMEVAAVRLLRKLLPSLKVLIVTTEMIQPQALLKTIVNNSLLLDD